MDDIYRRLGERVRSERERLGWTQEELGERAGMHPSYIGQIERFKKKVSLAAVDLLATALHMKPGDLLDDGRLSYRSPAWNARIEGLLRDKSPDQKAILYSTLKQLAKSLKKSR